ncbi:MAG: hypothetical protein KDC87_13260 [Planctomycetes bacterium]|nr:hypothetical protein [Planctomycetota bacterium]
MAICVALSVFLVQLLSTQRVATYVFTVGGNRDVADDLDLKIQGVAAAGHRLRCVATGKTCCDKCDLG